MDLTASVISEIKNSFSTDQEYQDYLNSLGGTSNRPSQDEIDRIIRVELGDFKRLSRDVLEGVLEKHNWNCDECYGTLISLLETKDWQQKRAENILEKLRQTLTASEIQSAIDLNDGDIEKTAAQLLEKGRDEKEAERDSILETLIARFRDIKVDVILNFLQDTNYSIQLTLPKLIEQRRQNLVDNFHEEFSTIPREQIFYAIEANDNRSFDKTRANLMQIFKEQEISKNVAKTQDNTNLERSRLTEIVHLVNQDLKQTADTAIANNFTNIFDNFVREETKLPGNRPVEASEPSKILGNSQFSSTILSAPVNQESPVSGDVTKEVLTKDLDASKQIIKMKVPERVDFGDKIAITWSHTGTPHPCDWVAMYAEGKATSDSDYYNWQWIPLVTESVLTPIVFDAPYSAASNFYFKYFSNRSYVCCAESEVVKVGPIFSIHVEKCVETKNQSNLFSATLRVNQEGGKECSHLWIALYASGVQVLKNFITYQYCAVNKDIVMNIPKSGAWTFKLFPFKSYEPIVSLPYFIDGEDKIQLQLVGSQFIISYHIKTISLDQRPWIGIYETSEEKTGLWKRYKYAQNFEGATTIEAGNLPTGKYEARLLDYDTSTVCAKSEIVTV
jgi:hypothetical protein